VYGTGVQKLNQGSLLGKFFIFIFIFILHALKVPQGKEGAFEIIISIYVATAIKHSH